MNEFRRMMQRVLKNKWQQPWIVGCLVVLSAGLLISRALVSFASIAMIVPFLSSFNFSRVKKNLLPAIGLILLPVMISVFWSKDLTGWWNSLSVKLPLLTMMLGLSVTHLSREKWILTAWIYISIISMGCGWSLFQYAENPAAIQVAYLQAKVLPTLADNDYVRFSWMVVIAILLGVKCLLVQQDKTSKIILGSLLAFLVIYLHILASKTGLICLYTGSLIFLLHLIVIQKKWKPALIALLGMLAVATIAYTTLPTLRNRIQYIRYDFSLYANGNFTPGYNDGARLLSIRAGYAVMQQHPVTGVGFGDIRPAINEWYANKYPQAFMYERFLPTNQWLVYGAGSGWPGMICFTAGLLLLLYASTEKNILSFLLSVIACIPLLTDDTLEGQFGVVLLSFIVFFGQQNLSPPSTTV